MHWIDWTILGVFILISIGIGLYFRRRASKSVSDFFVSGRRLPWWLAGTAVSATNFAPDTPMWWTAEIRNNGIAGWWINWFQVIRVMSWAFLFGRMWRRAELVTAVELLAYRYSGKAVGALRTIQAFLNAIVFNMLVMGWITLAMLKVTRATMSLPPTFDLLGIPIPSDYAVIAVLLIVIMTYSILSGLWGVVVNELFQWVIKWTALVALGILAYKAVGGVDVMREKVMAMGSRYLRFLPGGEGATGITWQVFFIYIFVGWWSAGAADGDPQFVQRISASINEKHGVGCVLWSQFLHYVVRPWPWAMVALASLILMPNLANQEDVYPEMMRRYLPPGFLGLLVAAFWAAYMSTVSTQLHLGSSFIIKDIFMRYVDPDHSQRYFVTVSRLTMFLLCVLGGIVAIILDKYSGIGSAWRFLTGFGAGLGPVVMLRWFWWRINVWSELSGLIATAFFATFFQIIFPTQAEYALRLLLTMGCTAAVWIPVTYLTKPEPMEKLIEFYRKVKPAGPGWKPVAALAPEVVPPESLAENVFRWLSAVFCMWSCAFAVGKTVVGEWRSGLLLACAAGVFAVATFKGLWKEEAVQLVPVAEKATEVV